MQNRRNSKTDSHIIFGLRAIQEAVNAGREIEKILIQNSLKSDQSQELIAQLSSRKVPFQKVPLEKLNKITRKNHQGFVGYLSPVTFASLENIIEQKFSTGKDPFILVLDKITDVRNFGAMARTAECAGIDALLVPEIGSALISGDAMKTSAGALNYLPVCRTKDLYKSVRFLKDSGLKIVSCTEKSETSIYQVGFQGPLAVVMGSEEKGIESSLLKLSDARAKIPMMGNIDSLNVSVSAGIIMYEAIRQREEQ